MSFDDDFAAFLDRIRPDAARRESQRELLHAHVRELQSLGFGALRLPVEVGGAGWSLEQLFAALVDLAAADSNLAHTYRGHLAFVEGLLLDGVTSSSTPLDPWVERIVAGDFVGNAQSERQETATITTRIHREGDDIYLTGTKYYTTGSIYADWIHLAALDGDDRVGLTVATSHHGVQSIDDWDGFGQLLTGSGTTTFDRVPVDPTTIVRPGDEALRWHYLGSIFQLALLAVIAGIARAALDDTVAFVRPRKRTFGFEGETSPRDDPLVQAVVGNLSSVADTSRRLILSSARELDAALARVTSGEATAEELLDAQLGVYRLQQVIPTLVLDALTRLFEVGGASAVSRSFALDRHWRNVRTIASHNPIAQRGRALGQYELNGTLPDWKAPGASGAPVASRTFPTRTAAKSLRDSSEPAGVGPATGKGADGMTLGRITLGDGLVSPVQGFGGMALADVYGAADDAESLKTLNHAIDVGVSLIDTADVYGAGRNERLVARVLADRRDDVVLATKFGILPAPDADGLRARGDAAYVRSSVDASLGRLGVDVIDLYYYHRVDPRVAIEETVGALAELVVAGKVRHVGLSEVTGVELERAHAVHPIAAVQSEWSIFSRDVENHVVPTAARLGVGFVAYSPLGRGLLAAPAPQVLPEGDLRRNFPRFAAGSLEANQQLAAVVHRLAEAEGHTPAQLALAWVYQRARALGVAVVPIPSTRRAARVDENVAAAGILLSPATVAELDALATRVVGTRSPDPVSVSLGRESA